MLVRVTANLALGAGLFLTVCLSMALAALVFRLYSQIPQNIPPVLPNHTPLPLRIVLNFAPCLMMFLLAGCTAQCPGGNSADGTPRILTGKDISSCIHHTPRFSMNGLAFFDDSLFALSSGGLIEVTDASVNRLYRWHGDYEDMDGMWVDEAHHLLWLLDWRELSLINYNGKEWKSVPLPNHPRGTYTRGDVLAGFQGVGNRKGFWLVGGGFVWRWDNAQARWHLESAPPHTNTLSPRVVRVAPLEHALLFLIQHSYRSDSFHYFNGTWREIPNKFDPGAGGDNSTTKDDSEIRSLAVTPHEAYACTQKGEVWRINVREIVKVDAPGLCKAVIPASNQTILARSRNLSVSQRLAVEIQIFARRLG